MSYVPRSPRRATRLSAVVDGVAGRVCNMSTSGMLVEASTRLAVGARVAVVPLLGELDGERLPGEVARVAERVVAVRFLGLDPDTRQRLRRTFAADESLVLLDRPVRRPNNNLRAVLPAVPESAPMFLLTDEPAVSVAPAREPPPAPSGEAATLRTTVERLEAQLLEAARGRHTLLEENARLKRESMSLQARLSVALSLRLRVDEDLAEARAAVDDLVNGEDALIRRIQTLEELLRRGMLSGW